MTQPNSDDSATLQFQSDLGSFLIPKMKKLSLLAMAALLAALSAQAQRGPGGPEGRGRFQDPIVQALDANQDGQIDAEELKNAAAALMKLDQNGDQALSQEEIRPQRGPRGPRGDDDRGGFGPPRGPGGQFGDGGIRPTAEATVESMMKWDQNKNGIIDAAELPNRMESLLARGDSDRDGNLTKAELLALMELEQ